MKKYLILTSIISCFSLLLTSCASLITHRDTVELTSTQTIFTTPIISSTSTTIVTTPPWVTQTGNHIVNSHSGYVIPNIRDKNITDSTQKTVVSAKIHYPSVVFYDNQNLTDTVNANLLYISHELELIADNICNRYVGVDSSSFLSTPSVYIDYRLEYFTKEAMSLKFTIVETDNNANIYKSYACYNLDLTTGSIIDPSSFFKSSDLSAISGRVSQILIDSGYVLYNDSVKLIQQQLQSSWYIGYNTLSICFNPGEISPTSEGSIQISIDSNTISDLLSEYGSAIFTVSYENN